MCAGGGGSRCEWILQDLMWAMVRSFGPADPVDALVGLFGRFAQFAVGRLLVRGDHSPSDVSLVGDPSGGVDSLFCLQSSLELKLCGSKDLAHSLYSGGR